MTGQEFSQWLDEYSHAFPSTRRWLDGLPTLVADAQLRAWRVTLDAVTLPDARAVTASMKTGELPRVGTFPAELEDTAVTVRKHAETARAQRERRETSAQRLDEWKRRKAENDAQRASDAFSCGALFRQYLAGLADGRTHDECRAELRRRIS